MIEVKGPNVFEGYWRMAAIDRLRLFRRLASDLPHCLPLSEGAGYREGRFLSGFVQCRMNGASGKVGHEHPIAVSLSTIAGSSEAMNIHSQTAISPLHSLFRVRK